jgi:hypothetical protein
MISKVISSKGTQTQHISYLGVVIVGNRSQSSYNQCLVFHVLMTQIVPMLQVIQNHS